ncbi:tautomerase family protein [Gilliamella sp. ESL0254]|uniref:tautomerase family protein n=1 Tax=Gilliamella sp. ESL0254 TaxID=2705035 RepID=UPI00406C8094
MSYSNNFIFIKITMNKGRTQQSKLQLYYKIAEQISRQLDISIDDVAICLIENEPINWSFGGGKMQFVA